MTYNLTCSSLKYIPLNITRIYIFRFETSFYIVGLESQPEIHIENGEVKSSRVSCQYENVTDFHLVCDFK